MARRVNPRLISTKPFGEASEIIIYDREEVGLLTSYEDGTCRWRAVNLDSGLYTDRELALIEAIQHWMEKKQRGSD